MKTFNKILNIFGYIFLLLVLYLFLVLFNIIPDEFDIKEFIDKIAY